MKFCTNLSKNTYGAIRFSFHRYFLYCFTNCITFQLFPGGIHPTLLIYYLREIDESDGVSATVSQACVLELKGSFTFKTTTNILPISEFETTSRINPY